MEFFPYFPKFGPENLSIGHFSLSERGNIRTITINQLSHVYLVQYGRNFSRFSYFAAILFAPSLAT